MLKLILLLFLPAWLSISWHFPWLWSVAYLFVLTSFIALSVFSLIFWCHVSLSSPHQPSLFLLDKVEKEMRQLEEIIKEEQSEWGQASKRGPLPVIFGRTVDSQLQLLLEYALRDFVLRALEPWVHRPEPVVQKLKEHLWTALQNLHERLLKVDAEKLIAQDMVSKITQHFERIRIAQTCAAQLGQAPVLALAPHLVSPETELHYLRQTSELLLILLLPRAYRLSPACHALREVLACKILQPCIDQLTEPDSINKHLLQHLQALRSRRALTAATFAEYIQLIQNCDSPETLRQLRYDTVSQMMQVTTLASVRRGRGGTESEARALRRYVQQLGVARAACDAALARLTADQPAVPSEPQDKALGLHEILQSSNGRRALSRHLERACAAGLVPLWWGAERLRRAPPHKQHALAADLYYTHVRAPASPIHVDKETRRRMEAFLLGNSGVEVFHELQNRIEEALREHYASFLLSHHYRDLQDHLEDEEDESEQTLETEGDAEEQPGEGGEMDSALEQQSTYARRKLNQLREKHDNKMQALAALRASLRPEARALALLAAEVERLAAERRRLEAHLARADAWAKHLGRWRATVHHAQVVEENSPPQFVIVVHVAEGERPETEASEDTQPEDITTGWVLVRSLQEFQDLHRKLRPLCAELKHAELPGSALKSLFGKSENALQQAKQRAQNYLDLVLSDERLTASEALYAFLSPSADHLKQSDLPKKNKFSFATLFKSSSSSEATRSSMESGGGAPGGGAGEEDDGLYLDEFDPGLRNIAANRGSNGNSNEDRDGLAEPLYALLGEVFDLRGLFRWLRRTLVTFVQITYGRTINRQIKESVWWACSESMLHSYVSAALHAWWPHGQLAPPAPPRTAQEVEETREAARRELTAYVVGVAGGLLGARAAGRGARKLHRILQDHTHNKLLFYYGPLKGLIKMKIKIKHKQQISIYKCYEPYTYFGN